MLKTLPLLILCLSVLAQTPQRLMSFDDNSFSYLGSHPDSFVVLGDDLYALATVGAQRTLIKMENGRPATAAEVRHNNQVLSVQGLERHKDMLFIQSDQGLYVLEASAAPLRFLAMTATWVGTVADQVMILDNTKTLYRYIRGMGVEPVGKLDDGNADISHPYPFGDKLYYLAYEGGTSVELRTITASGTRALVDNLEGSTSSTQGFTQTVAVESGGELFIAFSRYNDGSQVWGTDGTAAGTHLLFERYRSQINSDAIHMVAWNQGIAFSLPHEERLYEYAHGQLNSTTIDNTEYQLNRLTPLGQNLLFVGQAGVYRKGTSGAPQLLYRGRVEGDERRPMPVAGGKAYVFATGLIWSSDGTQAGSGLRALFGYHTEGDPFPHNGSVFASGNREGFYPELLTLPANGQPQVQELNPDIYIYDQPAYQPRALGNHLVYLDPSTHKLHAVTGNSNDLLASDVHSILTQTELLVYFMKNLDTGTELWRTDGTLAGTALVLRNGGPGNPSLHFVYPSGNVLYHTNTYDYNVTVHRLGANGESELIDGTDLSYFTLFADGLGGIYLTGQKQYEYQLWYAGAADNTFQLLHRSPASYMLTGPEFRMVGTRMWMKLDFWSDGPTRKMITLISSDGTAAGTFTYVEGAHEASLPIDVEGRAGMIVAVDDLEGFFISDGSGPLDHSELRVVLATKSDLFSGHGLGQVFGTEEREENQLWRYNLDSGEAHYLATLAPGLRPFQRVEVGETTLLMLAGQARIELWQSDGTVEGTERLAALLGDAKPGLALDERFYFSARGPAGDRHDRLYTWSAAEGVQLLTSAAALSQPTYLTATTDNLYFLADDQYHYGLYRLGEDSVLPPVQLSAKRLPTRGALWRITAEQIAGASYRWQIQNGTAIGPLDRASLLIRPSRQVATKITVIVTLANGAQRVGTLDLAVPVPIRREPTTPIKARH